MTTIKCSRGPRSLSLQTPFLKIWHQKGDFGAFSKAYDVVDFGPRIGVVAAQDSRILMVAQYRFLIDRISWEIPGGTVDPGETPETAAQREVLEETGWEVGGFEPLIEYFPGLDNVDNRTHILVASQAVLRHAFEPDPREVVEIAWVPVQDCLARIYSSEILDAMTIASVMSYAVRRGIGAA